MKLNNLGMYNILREPGAGGEPGGGGGAGSGAPPAPGTVISGAGAGSPPPPGQSQQGQAPTIPEWLAKMEGLEEGTRKEASLAVFKSPAEAVKGFVELKKLDGSRVTIPGEKSTPEEVNKFYAKLGRPDSVDGYKLPEVQIPKGLMLNRNLQTEIVRTAWDLGLNQKQVEGLIKKYWEGTIKEHAGFEALLQRGNQECIQKLKDKHGDKFQEVINIAGAAVVRFGGPELSNWLEETGFGNDANMINLFYGIGMATGEHGKAGSGGNLPPAGGPDDPAAAKVKLEEFKNNKDMMAALLSRDHKEHVNARKVWDDLHKAAFPGKEPITG